MTEFEYRGGELFAEEVPVRSIAASAGTPVYVYSRRAIEGRYRELESAFGGVENRICYSVKANGNLSLLRLLAALGSGFDVVSGGELERVLAAGSRADRVVFAGVGKTEPEIARAIEAGVFLLNVESEAELAAIDRVAARAGRIAAVSIRVNPDVDPMTHRYISTGKEENKFGLDVERARGLADRLGEFRHVRLAGAHMHIGSQITKVDPYEAAFRKLLDFATRCRESGHPIEWVNMGGGFGIAYREEDSPPPASAYAERILDLLGEGPFRLLLEPGRFLVGNAGILVSRVEYVKTSGARTFVIADAAMNDLIRPALYGAYHRILPVAAPSPDSPRSPKDVVGPICESGDFLAQDRLLPELARGDLVAVLSTGAYGAVMASNYNARPRGAEVLVEGSRFRTIRRRETIRDLIAPEIECAGEASVR